MKTIQKIMLYAAAGASLLGAGCRKEANAPEYMPELKTEQKLESQQEQYRQPGFFYEQQKALEDLADSSEKFSKELRLAEKEFRSLAEFEKEYWTEMAKLDEEERMLKEKRLRGK